MFHQVFSSISVLISVLAIGWYAAHAGIIDQASRRSVARIVLSITLPFLYFHSLATQASFSLLEKIWPLPFFAVFFVIFGYVIARLLSARLHLSGAGKATFVYLATFTNCGFLAIPIANMLYGNEGVVRVVFFNIGFNLLYWTLGVYTLRRSAADRQDSGGQPVKAARYLLNAGTIGLFAGLIAGISAAVLPGWLVESSSLVGSATIPLALLVVGSIMKDSEYSTLKRYRIPLMYLVPLRLLAIPLCALYITGACDFLSPLSRAVIVLQTAMPSASTTPIFTTRFGGDSHFASVGVFATTACSIITIPLILSLL